MAQDSYEPGAGTMAMNAAERQVLYRKRQLAENFRIQHGLENLVKPCEFLDAVRVHIAQDHRIKSVELSDKATATFRIILEDTAQDRKGYFWVIDCISAWKSVGVDLRQIKASTT